MPKQTRTKVSVHMNANAKCSNAQMLKCSNAHMPNAQTQMPNAQTQMLICQMLICSNRTQSATSCTNPRVPSCRCRSTPTCLPASAAKHSALASQFHWHWHWQFHWHWHWHWHWHLHRNPCHPHRRKRAQRKRRQSHRLCQSRIECAPPNLERPPVNQPWHRA